jgi:hypothetical protein
VEETHLSVSGFCSGKFASMKGRLSWIDVFGAWVLSIDSVWSELEIERIGGTYDHITLSGRFHNSWKSSRWSSIVKRCR